MYVKALAILLLLSGLIAGLWKFGDYCADSREAEVRLEVALSEGERQKEIIRLQQLLSEQRIKAEAAIAAGQVKHDKGTRIIEKIVDNCIDQPMPVVAVGVLETDGIYQRP